MLLQSVSKVSEIDDQISALHEQLRTLYARRAELLTKQPQQNDAPKSLKHQAAATSALYDDMVEQWSLPATLPEKTHFDKALRNASEIITVLEQGNSQLKGKLHVVPVPPRSVLKELLMSAAPQFVIADNVSLDELLPRSRKWQLLVLFDTDLAQEVLKLEQFLATETNFKGYNVCSMGLAELIVARMLGYEVVRPGQWTLIFESLQADSVLCATTSIGSNVVNLAYDDSRVLLGDNFVYPAIKV